MSLITRLMSTGVSSPVSPFPSSLSQIIPMHVNAVPAANFRKVVEQLTPHLAANPIARDAAGGIQLPAEVMQALNLPETVVAQLLIQSGSQIAGLQQPVAAQPIQDPPAIQPALPIGPPPPPPVPCTAIPNDVGSIVRTAGGCVNECQIYQNQANAALQAGQAAPDCPTRLMQANNALSALASLDSSAEEASSCVGGIDYLTSQAGILKCSQIVTATLAQAKAAVTASATQANQIATSAATTMLLSAAQSLQAQALAQCGPSVPLAAPAPNSIRVVTMWYGLEFQMDEQTTKDFESICDTVAKGGGITGAIVNTLKAAVLGGNAVAGAVVTAIVTVVPLLVETAMKNADQGNGVTLHCSLVPIVGASIVFGFNIPSELATIEALLEAGTLGIGVGGNPILNVFWVTGN